MIVIFLYFLRSTIVNILKLILLLYLSIVLFRIRTNMEKNLDRVMEELIATPEVSGCVFADHQGLCLGAKGKASTDTAGVIAAIAEQAAKLEPKNKMPVIYLEKDSGSCTIHRTGTVTGAIFKNAL